MPSSSRKRLTRRQNSDEIEDSRPSQSNGHTREDVSDDDSHPARRATNGVKKEKLEKLKKEKRPVELPEEEEALASDGDDDDDDDDDRIDVDNFPDQPIRKDDLRKLEGFVSDWQLMKANVDKNDTIYSSVAVALAELSDFVDNKEELKALDKDIKDFMDVRKEMALHEEALRNMIQTVARGEPLIDAKKVYQDLVEEKMEDYAGKTTRQKYIREDLYKDFQGRVWEVQHPNEPMPPLTDLIPKEDGDEEDDEDDLEMGGVTQQYNCPLTLTPLVDPMTSKVCDHSFSKAPLHEYFKVLLAFKAGRATRREGTNTVMPSPAKGAIYVTNGEDGLLHFLWRNRVTNDTEEDLILFPGDASFVKVSQSRGRVYVLKFSSSNQRHFFWMQDASDARDAEFVANVNGLLEDPDYDCQWNVPVTEASQASTSAAPAAASSSTTGSAQPTQDQIASLARLLTSVSEATLNDILTPANLGPLFDHHPELIPALFPHLPPDLPVPPSADALNQIIHSPQFRAAVSNFDQALRTGLLGGLVRNLGLPEEAGTGVSAFLRAIQEQADRETGTSMDTD
ncbi:hypothetical protein D9619_007295 [Psilocybe cf. subviscida]|uniref:Pru domain-containing protein n=1 Tax=Psilocybe cf. subviscida TaxID=2480587 RepID=A0A8H5B1Z9_9AGAR|nr:hypothetical protein D9619_007295 [Psilocybe cf. subviscida]